MVSRWFAICAYNCHALDRLIGFDYSGNFRTPACSRIGDIAVMVTIYFHGGYDVVPVTEVPSR